MSGTIKSLNAKSKADTTPRQEAHLLHFKFEDLDLIKTIGTGTFGRVLLCKSKVNLEDIVNHEVGWGRVCKSSSFFCHVS